MASPLITAMWAPAGGSGGTAYPSANLYGHLGSAALHDVTSGGNGYCGGNGAAGCDDPNTLGYGYGDCSYIKAGQAVASAETSAPRRRVPQPVWAQPGTEICQGSAVKLSLQPPPVA